MLRVTNPKLHESSPQTVETEIRDLQAIEIHWKRNIV